ncbi:SMP-30/gluconolactonase/LRE family protein [Natrinema sp. 1APR25-10V2]|uniref:SMP-30/gluconolactonase/LRE family protein n=1 Tax=Natrinema sp. 1APR25-10V2 TaxID=2951081 RepID=UPI0028766D50|nr:SMP-30/gluconolactonase/LRE family protein [Natrinema sp. 1APR25-10V2]MDS0474766.1 SMP-30/gluconolactonase/LRE family protein [Natrinema sp. 1APR25-10V2]
MTNDSTNRRGGGRDARGRPSRRSLLRGVAAAGALAGIPSGVLGRQDAGAAKSLEIVTEFEPPALPENLAIDDGGTVYGSMGPAGQILAIDSQGNQSSVATIETGEQGLLLGVTILDSVLYVANASGQPETHGIWRVDPESGESERVAALSPEDSTPNGIIPDPTTSDALLVSDHLAGAIWRVTTDGQAEVWVEDPLLEPSMEAQTPVGADGLAAHPDGGVYVDNLNAGSVIRVPVNEDGSAGQLEQIVQDQALVGADGMTIDQDGSVYVAVNSQNKISRVTSDGAIQTVVSGSPLDFPADVHFGTTEETATTLYVANFAYGTFLQDPEAAAPSLARLDVDARGYFPQSAGDGDGTSAGNETETGDAVEDDE